MSAESARRIACLYDPHSGPLTRGGDAPGPKSRGVELTDAEFQTLAQMLAGFGITLNLTDAEGRQLVAGRVPRRDASAEAPRTVSMNLADGRRLVLVPDAEAERRNAEARLRFRVLAEHSQRPDRGRRRRPGDPLRVAGGATVMLDIVPDELHGRTLAELLAPEDRAGFIARHFMHATAPRTHRHRSVSRCCGATAARCGSRRASLLLPPGNGLGDYLVTLRDAEQRKQCRAGARARPTPSCRAGIHRRAHRPGQPSPVRCHAAQGVVPRAARRLRRWRC